MHETRQYTRLERHFTRPERERMHLITDILYKTRQCPRLQRHFTRH